ncbi:hypothetical protein RRG08_021836 [Elysia crispata]|uniref:Uncharacterized protein n=1 Tax=Elysia crispata TaxID=231223 RepID=A0AAE0ZZA6_9GAST|nr:hypothetical protein RRG08_021836 [Elysia crispata]
MILLPTLFLEPRTIDSVASTTFGASRVINPILMRPPFLGMHAQICHSTSQQRRAISNCAKEIVPDKPLQWPLQNQNKHTSDYTALDILNMVTSISVSRVLSLMLITSLLHVNSEVNLLPSWTFGRNRGGNHRTRARSRELSVIRPRGNCATYIDTSGQPSCAADEIVYFDLETCRLTCGTADRLPVDSQNVQY